MSAWGPSTYSATKTRPPRPASKRPGAVAAVEAVAVAAAAAAGVVAVAVEAAADATDAGAAAVAAAVCHGAAVASARLERLLISPRYANHVGRAGPGQLCLFMALPRHARVKPMHGGERE
jgi:hypothetical protein